MLCIYLPSLFLGNLEWWTRNPSQCTCEAHAFPLSWTPIPEIMIFFFNELESVVLTALPSSWTPDSPFQSGFPLCPTPRGWPYKVTLVWTKQREFSLAISFSASLCCRSVTVSYPLMSQASLSAKPGRHLFQTRKTGACFSSSVNQQLCDRASGGLS